MVTRKPQWLTTGRSGLKVLSEVQVNLNHRHEGKRADPGSTLLMSTETWKPGMSSVSNVFVGGPLVLTHHIFMAAVSSPVEEVEPWNEKTWCEAGITNMYYQDIGRLSLPHQAPKNVHWVIVDPRLAPSWGLTRAWVTSTMRRVCIDISVNYIIKLIALQSTFTRTFLAQSSSSLCLSILTGLYTFAILW